MATNKQQIGPGRPPLYPWDEWLSQHAETLELTKGVHYHCKSYSFVERIRDQLKKRNLRASISVSSNGVMIRFCSTSSLEREVENVKSLHYKALKKLDRIQRRLRNAKP